MGWDDKPIKYVNMYSIKHFFHTWQIRGWNKFYSIQLTSFIFISVSLKVTFSLTISLWFLLYSWSIVKELRRSASSLTVLAETNYYIYSTTILEKKGLMIIYICKRFVYSLTSPYGHLSITDSSYSPRNAKNHTFPTFIIQTPM